MYTPSRAEGIDLLELMLSGAGITYTRGNYTIGAQLQCQSFVLFEFDDNGKLINMLAVEEK